MSNDEDIDFYEENEEEEEINNSMGKYKDNKPKNDKKIKSNAANTLYDGDEEEEEINERKNKKKKTKEIENMEFLKELKEEDKKDEKEDDLNNSRDYGEDNEPNEPDFYADEDDGDDENINVDYQKSENKNEVKIKQKNIKKEIFDINNIYEINNKFHYNKDSELFYILEKDKEYNYYPKPLSSKQLVNLIREENISYDSLQIKLVDLFEFKLKLSFSYVELKEILKPGWTSDVDYSKIFKELSKLYLNDNNIKEEKDNSINFSNIKIENESFSFSLFKYMENDTNKNKKGDKGSKKEDKKEDKKEVKKEGNNKTNRNKKKGRKKGEDIDIKTGFIYDN